MTLGSRYQILALAGSGTMGTVYRARDLELDEVVALKVLHASLADDASTIERFRREAKLARRITHPNVARVHDIAEHDGLKFLTMEYVDGESLASVLRARGALPLVEVRRVARAVCDGLAAAHDAGVVHRDLKPDNILIARDGRIAVTDFGIARAVVDRDALTRTLGALVGTPAYMAPEQIEDPDNVDLRCDLYAFGAVLFELLTGERAWTGPNLFVVMSRRLGEPPPDPRALDGAISEALADVVKRAMARQRDDRFSSAGELGDALETCLSSAAEPRSRRPRRPTSSSLAATKTVAVLPFRYVGPPSDEYFADGLTDDLIDTLSMTRGLRVRPRGMTTTLKSIDVDPREVARTLDVQVVVEGSVRRMGTATRLSARVIHVSDGIQIWAQRFDVAQGDFLVAADRIAHGIAEALTADLTTSRRHEASDPDAIELYLRGRRELRASWSGDLSGAVELLESAVARAPADPNLVATWALALSRLAFLQGGATRLRARQAAERAVVVAPNLGESWVALAATRVYFGDQIGAAEALRSGVHRIPTSGRLRAALARVQLEVDVLDEAIRQLETAMQLDPTVPDLTEDLARAQALRGAWTEVDALLARPVDDDHGRLTRAVHRARLDLWRGNAVEVPDAVIAANIAALPLKVLLLQRDVARGHVTHDRLDDLEAEAMLPRPRFSLLLWQLFAELSAILGEHDRALAAVGRAIDGGLVDAAWLRRCPLLAGLRRDERWPALVARVEELAARLRGIVGSEADGL
ncbi:MAG: protein kinase [Kofleriaceae bacterium]|nr:protein kinase [Kofleriaceae bacterium]